MPTDTPLHKAAHQGDLDKVQKLINEGRVQVNVAGASERTPLHRAAGANHVQICKFLKAKGALLEQTDKTGRTPLHWACVSGRIESTTFLLGAGADLFAKNAGENLPLHFSAENGHVGVASVLIEHAGRRMIEMLTAKNQKGQVPYDLAFAGKHKDLLRLFKDAGDPNAVGSEPCSSCSIS